MWGLVAQSCPTLCDPTNCSRSGSSNHGIFQARILEWIAVPFSRGYFWPRDKTQASYIADRFFTIWATGKIYKLLYIIVIAVQSLSHFQLFATPWTAVCQIFLSLTISQSLLKFTPIASVMPSSHLILCHSLLHLP